MIWGYHYFWKHPLKPCFGLQHLLFRWHPPELSRWHARIWIRAVDRKDDWMLVETVSYGNLLIDIIVSHVIKVSSIFWSWLKYIYLNIYIYLYTYIIYTILYNKNLSEFVYALYILWLSHLLCWSCPFKKSATGISTCSWDSSVEHQYHEFQLWWKPPSQG